MDHSRRSEFAVLSLRLRADCVTFPIEIFSSQIVEMVLTPAYFRVIFRRSKRRIRVNRVCHPKAHKKQQLSLVCISRLHPVFGYQEDRRKLQIRSCLFLDPHHFQFLSSYICHHLSPSDKKPVPRHAAVLQCLSRSFSCALKGLSQSLVRLEYPFPLFSSG